MANGWMEINASDYLFPLILFSIICWLIFLSRIQKNGYLDKINATKALGFILMLRTQKGLKLLDQLSKPRKFWRIYGEISLWVCRASMVFIILFLFLAILLFIITGPTKDPMPVSTMIAVPGLNPVIPLGWGIFAFIVDIPSSPMDAATALPVQIFLLQDNQERAFVERTSAAIMVLLLFLFFLNITAVYLRKKLEKKW